MSEDETNVTPSEDKGVASDGILNNIPQDTEAKQDEVPPAEAGQEAAEEAPKEGEAADKPEVPAEEAKKVEEAPKEEKKKLNLTDEQVKEINTHEKASELLKTVDFDYTKLQEEFNANGDLSKETREKLAEVGITGVMIDNFINGQKAIVAQQVNEVAESVGGMSNLKTIYEWAIKNKSEAEIASINKINDVNVLKIVMKDLKRDMEDKEGILPKYTRGEGSKVSTGNMYESRSQVMDDMMNPSYQKDESFRAKVAQKLKASIEAGVIQI